MPAEGPRGGTTTVTQTGMVKKNLWVPETMGRWVRDEAYKSHQPEAEIIRRAVSLRMGLGAKLADDLQRESKATGQTEAEIVKQALKDYWK